MLRSIPENQKTDVRKVAVTLVVIQTIAYHKFVWNLESGIIYLYIDHTAIRLIQKRAQRHGLRSACL